MLTIDLNGIPKEFTSGMPDTLRVPKKTYEQINIYTFCFISDSKKVDPKLA